MKSFVDIHDVTHVYARAEDGVPAVRNLTLIPELEIRLVVHPSVLPHQPERVVQRIGQAREHAIQQRWIRRVE